MPKRGHAKTTRHLHNRGEKGWVKELGVNKITYKTNRILRKWGVNCPITVITLPYPKVDFILEEPYFYAISIRGWVGFCDCWRHDPQNYIAVVILKSPKEPSITILFGRRDAECKIDISGREICHFVGGHSRVVAEALKIIALSSL